MYCTRKVNDDYTWVGADGRRLAMFEGVFDVPNGISFNSYLLRDEKTVLFDTADAAVRRTFRENLLHALEGRPLDCVVVHHMEPDHTAELEELVLRFPEVQIYCSAMAKTMMTQFFGPGFQERIHVVKEGDTLCTGRHTLRFIAAPMVHWPEGIVTYDVLDKVLFSADGFGKFGALDVDEPWDDEARRYYIGIVGKYGAQVQALLKKAATLDIQTICPLHGPVLKENLGHYIRLYDLWSSYTVETEGVEQEDWQNGWRKYYHPLEIGKRLAVVPSWQQYDTDRVKLILDPGLAFGTGGHETTSLCMEALDERVTGGERVLDIGTGSGILAIAALKLGAAVAEGVDIDPVAVRTAGENAALNGVQDKLTVLVGDLSDKASGKYDIITANIVANAILSLAPAVPGLMAEGATFIASGIIDSRKDEVIAGLEKAGLAVVEVKEKRGWECIVCKKA